MLGQAQHPLDVLENLRGAELRRVRLGAGEVLLGFDGQDGTWLLATAGSGWALVRDGEPLVQDQDDEEAIRNFDTAIGCRVRQVEAAVNGLRIDLTEGLSIYVARSDDPDLAVFQFDMPWGNTLILHHDGVVDDVPSDIPIPALLEEGRLHHWPDEPEIITKPRS